LFVTLKMSFTLLATSSPVLEISTAPLGTISAMFTE